jgi:hypothetical protein
MSDRECPCLTRLIGHGTGTSHGHCLIVLVRLTLMYDRMNDDHFAECEAIDLPGITPGSSHPQSAGGFAPAPGSVQCWPRRDDQRRYCRPLAEGDGTRMAEAPGTDDERAVVGGHTEPQASSAASVMSSRLRSTPLAGSRYGSAPPEPLTCGSGSRRGRGARRWTTRPPRPPFPLRMAIWQGSGRFSSRPCGLATRNAGPVRHTASPPVPSAGRWLHWMGKLGRRSPGPGTKGS